LRPGPQADIQAARERQEVRVRVRIVYAKSDGHGTLGTFTQLVFTTTGCLNSVLEGPEQLKEHY